MNTDDLKKSLLQNEPPAHLPLLLKALWYDAKGDWQKAHELVQDETGRDAAHIHAYLHRSEGDIWNADYWYGKAGRKRPGYNLAEEWEQIAIQLLAKS